MLQIDENRWRGNIVRTSSSGVSLTRSFVATSISPNASTYNPVEILVATPFENRIIAVMHVQVIHTKNETIEAIKSY